MEKHTGGTENIFKTGEKCFATDNTVDDTDSEIDLHITDTQSSTIDKGTQNADLS